MSARGLFLVLDGIDGCGKSTQAERLVRRLGATPGPPPVHLREPGGTQAGERIRELLLDRDAPLAPAAQTLLFAAARRQLLEQEVRPALAAGRDVVCERFHPSTFAYQGYALGVGEDAVWALLEGWAGSPRPDLTLVLEIDPGAAQRRRSERQTGPAGADRYEARESDFHQRVAEGYRRWAARAGAAGARVALLPADGDREQVAERIWQEVQRADRPA